MEQRLPECLRSALQPRQRLKKEILSDDFKKRKIFWKNIAENFPPHITIHTRLHGATTGFMVPAMRT
jgi:hypothetical protein